MVKIILRLIFVIIFLSLSSNIIFSKEISIFKPTIEFEDGLAFANEELSNLIGRNNYFINEVDGIEIDANEYIWDEYTMFSSNNSHGKNKYVSSLEEYLEISNYQYEFLGINGFGDSVPNPYYPPDEFVEREIVTKWTWISDVERREYISYNSYDYKQALSPSEQHELTTKILDALEEKFSPYFNREAADALPDSTWLSRAGIVIPPTRVSRGMVRFWHDVNGVIWYTNVIIDPLYNFTPEFSIASPEGDCTDETLVISGDEVTITLQNHTDIGDTDVTEYVKWYRDGETLPFHETYTPMTAEEIKNQTIQIDLSDSETFQLVVKVRDNPEVKVCEHDVTIHKDVPVPMTVPMPTGQLIVASNTPGNEIYDVARGIPTGEEIYTSIRVGSYIAEYATTVKTGGRNVRITFTGTYEDGTPVNVVKTVRRTYSYVDIAYFYVYKVNEVVVTSEVLPGGGVRLSPSGIYDISAGHTNGSASAPSNRTITVTSVPLDYDFASRARREAGSYSTSDGTVELNGLSYEVGSTIPEPELTQDGLFYKEDITIPHNVLNRTNISTTAEVKYEPVYLYNKPADIDDVIVDYISGNTITVHTPVVCYPSVESNINDVQLINPNLSMVQLTIEGDFTIHFPTEGSHRNMPGYGDRDYASTTKKRQVLFQFDVFRGVEASGTFLPSNTWIDIDQDETTFYIPPWVHEYDRVNVGFRSIAKNIGDENAPYATGYNGSIETYKAIAQIPVQISSKIYGFRVTGSTDPFWIDHFSLSANDFLAGSRSFDGQLLADILTLPLMPDKNRVDGYHPYALRLGYKYQFELITNGDFFQGDDLLVIEPTYFHVDDSLGNRQQIDLYLEGVGGFQKLGSDRDKTTNMFVLNDDLRDVALNELEDTAKILESQARGNGMSYNDYLEFFSGQYAANLRLGEWIVLTEKQKTFIGPMYSVPFISESLKIGARQKWYGEHYIPNNAYAVPSGTDLSAYDRLKIGEAPFISGGYIIVHYDIRAYHNIYDFAAIGSGTPYSEYASNYNNMWLTEGFEVVQKGVQFEPGDVVFYHTDLRASDHYK